MANEKTYPNYLMHYRTKGSKNGISTTKGYTAVGQKAKGQYINGRYVYPKAGADILDQNIYGKKIKGYTRLADISPYEKQRLADKYLSNSPQHNAAVNQHNAEVAGRNSAWEYQAKSARERVKRQHNAEQAGRNQALENARKASARNAKAKALAEGAKNNWQQKANKTAGILGGMTREDRSAAQKIEPYKVNDPFSVAEYSQHGVNKRRDFNNDMEYGNSYVRNRRSDIGNAIADAKVDAKKAFKEAKADAKQAFVNLKSKVKKKKKSLKDLFK